MIVCVDGFESPCVSFLSNVDPGAALQGVLRTTWIVMMAKIQGQWSIAEKNGNRGQFRIGSDLCQSLYSSPGACLGAACIKRPLASFEPIRGQGVAVWMQNDRLIISNPESNVKGLG